MAMMALPLTSDCVGMWRCEEATAGADLVDTSGNGYTLTEVDSPAVITPGTVGTRARRFVSTKRAYLTSGTYPLLRPASGDITVAMIVRPLSGYSHPLPRCLMLVPRNWSSYYLPGYGICSKTNNSTDFRFDTKMVGSSSTYSAGGTAALATDTWHLLVGTFDASAMTVNFYVDGALQESVSTAPYNAIDLATGGSAAPMYVGANPYFITAGISYWAYCDIDEMAIYTTAKDANWSAVVYNGLASTLFSLSAVSLEYASLGIARKAVEQAAGNTLAAPNSLFSLSGVSVEYMPLNRLRPMGSARSA